MLGPLPVSRSFTGQRLTLKHCDTVARSPSTLNLQGNVPATSSPLPPDVIAGIMTATDGTTASDWWAGESEDGPQLSDQAVDWIEATANDEEATDG